jgi:predicted N-acyltransferase
VDLEVAAVSSLEDVLEAEWDALVAEDDPFTHYGFLRLLETSESVAARGTGWTPCHVLVRRAGKLIAALPLYLKQHSYGEFIFDFGWAQAAFRAGISYYPKLVSAVPLTPATGRRLLTHPSEDRAALVKVLVEAARKLMHTMNASSLHFLFCTEEESALLSAQGLAPRKSVQYHLDAAPAVLTFQDYVAALRHSARKQVRRERREAQAAGFRLSMRPVAELDARDNDALWHFYNTTIDQHGSSAYLTRAFFHGLAGNRHAFAAMAHEGEEAVAGALFFVGQRSMFGRYWGAARDVPMLHFELCYYFPIEWGLLRGIRHFEAGAQGEHKIKRGFLPAICHSAHVAAHPGLDRAIAEFVSQEGSYVEREQELLAQSTPFKRGE